MSLHVGGRGPGHLVRTGGAFYPTATAAFDFQLQQYRNGAGTYSVSDLSALTGWSFSRASPKTAPTGSGAVVSFASGVPAITDLGFLIEEARTNSFLNSDVGATQSVTTTATSWTLSFYGTGSITLSGGATGTLNGTGASNRVSLTVTAAAASTTLTVAGPVTSVQFEAGASASSYIAALGTAATRVPDGPSETVTAPAAWTMVVDAQFTTSATAITTIASWSDSTLGQGYRFEIQRSASGVMLPVVRFGGSDQIVPTGVTKNGARIVKAAISFNGTSLSFTVDGVETDSNLTVASVPLATILWLGRLAGATQFLNDSLRRLVIYPNATTAAQRAALTQ
jgi:hypothetical protein